MRSKLASHIHFNRVGVAGFRIVVPKRLRSYFHRTEFRLSLRTRELATAKAVGMQLSVFITKYFQSIERMRKEPADHKAATFAENLEQERDRLVQEMTRFAHDPHEVEERRDDLATRIALFSETL